MNRAISQVASRGRYVLRSTKSSFPIHVLPAVLVVYACMLPRELTFEIATVAFQPFRTTLTLLMPFVLFLAGKQKIKPSFVDWLIIFASFWIFAAMMAAESLSAALVTGLSEGLNLAFAYFVGRVALQNSQDLRSFFKAILPGLLICTCFLAAESISHHFILRPLIARIVGQPIPVFPSDLRIGLLRAVGPFPHAILGGVFMASFLPIAWYVPKTASTKILGLTAVAGFFFSVSTTGFMGFFVGAGLMFTNFIQRITRLPIFPAMVTGLVSLLVFVKVFSNGGLFSFLIRRMTFSSATGYYRMSIWTYAGADAWNHPLFGIGTRQYIRPAWMVKVSVDAHWLLLTLKGGFPYMIAVLGAMIGAATLVLRGGAASPYLVDKRASYAVGFSLISIIFTGLSVYLWEGMGIWMIVLTGMGVTLGMRLSEASRAPVAVRRRRPAARVSSRQA